jgi:hypothetical protein
VPAWQAYRAAACGAATLSCHATRAGAAKRVRSANNIFEMLFLKINYKKVKIKKMPIGLRVLMNQVMLTPYFFYPHVIG